MLRREAGLRAGLAAPEEDWPWGSLAQRLGGSGPGRPMRAEPPLPWPAGWTEWANAPQTAAEEEAVRRCARRGQPLGSPASRVTSAIVERRRIAVPQHFPRSTATCLVSGSGYFTVRV